MADVIARVPNNSGRKPTSRIIAGLGVVAAGVAGVAAFLGNADKIGTEARKLCEATSLCAHKPGAAPVLTGYDSPEMSGGSDPDKQCGPQLSTYQAQYPDFLITMKTWEDSDKDWLGHVTYHYHCRYSAAAK